MAKSRMNRAAKPVCLICKHPISFHGAGGVKSCSAHGCTCSSYKGETELVSTTLSVDEVAKRVGRGQTWVKANAKALGGKKMDSSLLYRSMGRSGQVWRFTEEGLVEFEQKSGS